MKVTEPEYESVIVLYVHVGGCIVWEGVDVIGGVVLTFEDIVFKTVQNPGLQRDGVQEG